MQVSIISSKVLSNNKVVLWSSRNFHNDIYLSIIKLNNLEWVFGNVKKLAIFKVSIFKELESKIKGWYFFSRRIEYIFTEVFKIADYVIKYNHITFLQDFHFNQTVDFHLSKFFLMYSILSELCNFSFSLNSINMKVIRKIAKVINSVNIVLGGKLFFAGGTA